MKTYIDSTVRIFENNKNIEVYTSLITEDYSETVSSTKWLELVENMAKTNRGKLVLSRAFNDKTARQLQWEKRSENEVFIEFFSSVDEKKWMFQHEYIITIADLEAFAPIHSYSMGIMKMLKLEIADKALADTTFLSREQQ